MKFIDGVYAIRDKQNEIFRHANYDPTAYFGYRSKLYPQPNPGLTYEPISLTYQPLTLKRRDLTSWETSVIRRNGIRTAHARREYT